LDQAHWSDQAYKSDQVFELDFPDSDHDSGFVLGFGPVSVPGSIPRPNGYVFGSVSSPRPGSLLHPVTYGSQVKLPLGATGLGLVEQDPGMAVGYSLPAKVSDDTNFDTFSMLLVQDKAYMDTSSASALQPESPILAGIQCDRSEVVPDEPSDSFAGTDFGLTKSQSWLLASLREAVQDDAVHLALMNDMEESWR
jgi:hypothetical protein